MNKTILITGASRGIGLACVKHAYTLGLNVIATARSKDILRDLQKKLPKIQIIAADISTLTGREKIASQISQPVDFLLHNAAVLFPPKKLIEIEPNELTQTFTTNVEPIIFLTKQLLSQLQKSKNKARILSITSRAGLNAYAGIGSYCISKAAALMSTNILKVELNTLGILINNYSPGVVDTGMQKTLRSSNDETFPHSSDFKQLKHDKKLISPEHIAKHILEVFTTYSTNDFIR